MRVKYVFMDFLEAPSQEFSPLKPFDGFSFFEIDFSKIVFANRFFCDGLFRIPS